MSNPSRIFCGLFVLVAVYADATVAQTKSESIDALMRKYFEYGQFNGSVLVAENGNVILKKGYGLANMEWDIPNSPDTKFRLGSITKQFTALLVMQQVEKGSLGLDDPVEKYLRDYPKPQGEKITIRHLLTHTSGTPNYTEILDIRHDRKPYSPGHSTSSSCSLATELGRIMNEQGPEQASRIFKELKEKTKEYSLRESEMNMLGYQFLQDGKPKAAIEVFTLNVEAYPKSWNVYDSLGEAYMNDGRTALAITNYEKSIELNPGNVNGVETLKKLKGKK